MSNALELNHLTKDFGSFALEDVSLTLPGGAILGLIGENGAGKTTLIKCILGLLRPTGGEVRVLGGRAEDPALRARIGVVLDECPFHDTLRPRQVGSILAGIYPTWDKPLFASYLDKFGLPEEKLIKTFSQGMKRKLCIAAALAHRPELLVLDEATSGLDPVVRDEILEELLAFIQDEAHAVLLSSHITSDLEKAADYIAYLHRGELLLAEEKDVLLSRYGRLACTAAQLEQVDGAFLQGVRRTQFGCEALVRDRQAFRRRYPDLPVDSVSLEEIMVYTVRGDAQ